MTFVENFVVMFGLRFVEVDYIEFEFDFAGTVFDFVGTELDFAGTELGFAEVVLDFVYNFQFLFEHFEVDKKYFVTPEADLGLDYVVEMALVVAVVECVYLP